MKDDSDNANSLWQQRAGVKMSMQLKLVNFLQDSNVILLSFLFLGLGLRVYNLGGHNFWYDEAISFVEASQMKSSSFMLYKDNQLYRLLLHYWIVFFGKSEFVLRSLSMVFGVLAIPLIYKLGKLFFDRRVGLASALILAISPIHIWYSQEARAYSLSVFLSLLIVYLSFLAIKKNKPYLWAGFAATSIIGAYTNYFCFYAIIISSIMAILINRRFLKQYAISLCFIFAGSLYLIPLFIKRFSSIKNSFWLLKPNLSAIVITFGNFNAGYNATAGIYFLSFIIFSSLFSLGFLHWWEEKRKELVFLSALIFVPILLTFLISQKVPIYLDRQLMLFSPFYYVIIAAGLVKIKANILSVVIYCLIFLLSSVLLFNYFSCNMPMSLRYHQGVNPKKPIKPAADYINSRFLKGDIIGYSGPTGTYLFYYLWDKIINEKIEVFSFVIKSKLEPYWLQRHGVCFAPQLITKHIIMLGGSIGKKLEKYHFKR